MGLKLLHSSCATDCDLKILIECALKIKTAGLLKNSFHTLFHVIIANGVSATIMQAYMPLSRHIRQRRVNETEYCVRLMSSSWLPAISQRIEKTSEENYV